MNSINIIVLTICLYCYVAIFDGLNCISFELFANVNGIRY